jgi:histidyl-tRNA synthetase
VQQYLTSSGIPFEVDPGLVRGLDYYNHTAFEIMSNAEGFGAITTLCGGGRYNGLAQEIGGPETPGIGFALSIERLLTALEAEGIELPISSDIDCYIVTMGDQAKDHAVSLLYEMRKAGLTAEKDYENKKMKAQFKAADRHKAKFVAVLGDDELAKNVIAVKNMETGSQEEIAIDQLISYLKQKSSL